MRTERLWNGLRIVISALFVIFLVAPMLIVVVISFSSAHFLTFPPPGYSLQWYRKLFGDPAWFDSLVTSIKIIVQTGLLAMVLGTAAALGIARSEFAGKRLVTARLMPPIV